MKSLAVRLAVALVTFTVGVSLTALMFGAGVPRAVIKQTVDTTLKFEVLEIQSDCSASGGAQGKRDETPEEKAVRLAEEFIARNGYTDAPHDRHSLSYESIEWTDNLEELLKLRHDSLERKAYGIFYSGRSGGKGWTVVFRHKERYGNHYDKTGRAVTMDGNFENLRVEHKSFFLGKVEKKF